MNTRETRSWEKWTPCEDCGTPVEVEATHNGVARCWHYVHCGWGHMPSEVYPTYEEAKAAGTTLLKARGESQ